MPHHYPKITDISLKSLGENRARCTVNIENITDLWDLIIEIRDLERNLLAEMTVVETSSSNNQHVLHLENSQNHSEFIARAYLKDNQIGLVSQLEKKLPLE